MKIKRTLITIQEEIGYLGFAQIVYFILIVLLAFYSCVQGLAYAFVCGDLNYRCRIDQCDGTGGRETIEYNPEWLSHAVPFDKDSGLPKQCYKYSYRGGNTTEDVCAADAFDTKQELRCNDFLFETEEETILNEYNLTCNENKWKLPLPGTIHNIGSLCNLLLIGYVSDRFGRKTAFIISCLLAVFIGVMEPFAPNYTSYVVLKFFETLLSGGVYSSGVVLVIELANPEHRAIFGTIMFASCSLGKVFLGFTAMLIENWKIQTFANFIPSILAIVCIWIIPESLKWLLIKKRYESIAHILLRLIRWNCVKVSPETLEILTNQPELMGEDAKMRKRRRRTVMIGEQQYPIWDVFNSTGMMLRLVELSFCWITNVFVFYGLTLISVAIGGNKYTNFMIVNAIEVPACILVMCISHVIGRKKILCPSLILSGVILFVYPFLPNWHWLKLLMFMIGKFAITVSFATIYIFTSEMLPTNLRHTLIGVCSAFGRIGSMVAPQAPYLDLIVKNLPMYLFGGTALVAGFLSLHFPETLHKDLPNTIEEALKLGEDVEEEPLASSLNLYETYCTIL